MQMRTKLNSCGACLRMPPSGLKPKSRASVACAVKPNVVVLEAQGRICTGPTQTRPLNEEQASNVLHTIIKSGAYLFTLHLIIIVIDYKKNIHNLTAPQNLPSKY
ncbi:hypothetical protein SUGI_0835190 [Cryptomeria japonica]|nr:hypothetical protein SUGI_0835190 [Cryptomeria japonica]